MVYFSFFVSCVLHTYYICKIIIYVYNVYMHDVYNRCKCVYMCVYKYTQIGMCIHTHRGFSSGLDGKEIA